MSPSRKFVGLRGSRRSHARPRHGRAVPRPAPSGPPPLTGAAVVPIPLPGDRAGDPRGQPDAGAGPDTSVPAGLGEGEGEGASSQEACDANGNAPRSPACSIVCHVVALEALGWRVVGLRPSGTGDEPALWRVTIERYDESATMSVTDEDPGVALAELIRYAHADAS